MIEKYDPELQEKIEKDFDKFEIRGSERVLIIDWINKAMLQETFLSLLRKDLINIVDLDTSGEIRHDMQGNEIKCITYEPMFATNKEIIGVVDVSS